MEIIGVTAVEKTYSVGFVFLESEKRGQRYLGFRSVSDNVEGQRKHAKDHWYRSQCRIKFFLHHMHYFVGITSERMWEVDLNPRQEQKNKGWRQKNGQS